MNKNNNKKNVTTNATAAEYIMDKNGNLRLTKSGAAMRTRRGMNLTPEEEEMVLAARRARKQQYVEKDVTKILSGVDTTKNQWKSVPTSSMKSVEEQCTNHRNYNPATASFASSADFRNIERKLMTLGFFSNLIHHSKFDGEFLTIEVAYVEDLIRELIKQGEL